MKNSQMFTLLLILCCISCNKFEDINGNNFNLEGYIQNGPFTSGSIVSLYELNKNLSQTGRSFVTETRSKDGFYEFENVNLNTEYVQINGFGTYLNAVENEFFPGKISIDGITRLEDDQSRNVNIITELEIERLKFLINEEGLAYEEAKKKVQREILGIFSITYGEMPFSEQLNIAKEGEENAILLAISLISQGFRNEVSLNQLLSSIKFDIKEDGVLDNEETGSDLLNQALLLDTKQIRTNLEEYYEGLEVSASIPNFEKYIDIFIENTEFTPSTGIQYPEFSSYGENILFGDKTEFTTNPSLAASLPMGASLKIIIKGYQWYFRVDPNGPINWEYTIFANGQQEFSSIVGGNECDLWMEFEPGTYTIEYYENNSEVPTRIKTIQF